MKNLSRTFDILARYESYFPDKTDALAGKVKGEWIKYSSREYIENSNLLSIGLLSLGINKGDHVVTVSNNRPEWNFFDMALSQIGAIHVPMFTNLDKATYINNITNCEAKMIVVSDQALAGIMLSLKDQLHTVDHLISFDETKLIPNWKTLLEKGIENKDLLSSKLEEIKNSIEPDACVTLIYTSGTTGTSKGVMLSHRNLLSTALAAVNVFQMTADQRYLSILPICHVGERMGCYQSQISGCSIYYGENLATIAADLLAIKPHGFGAVPRILEKVYDKIIGKGEKLTGIKRKLFFWAIDLGLKYKTGNENGTWYKLQLALANKLIFSKWRAALGGNIISIGVGGAALPPHIERVFWAAGIKLLNMYGLTETAPIITINRTQAPLLKLGTVGAVVEGVEVKIADDGEILCKGPNVMLGYYKDEQATKEALRDGWFHTGDIGELDQDGFLKITDRKKELFKLSNGKYVSPQTIENMFKESVYIDQLMVIGEGEKFTSALISPNFEALNAWCASQQIDGNNEAKITNPEVRKFYNDLVNKLNGSLGADDKVKRFRLVAEEWTPLSGELSPTLKLKRKVIAEKYNEVIKEIFLN